MRQLDLFQRVEDTKPQNAILRDKVNGDVNALSAESPKGNAVLDKPEPARIVDGKEEIKKEKPQPVQKETTFNGKRGRKSFKEMDADLVMVEVPDDEILFQKKYYAISEVAQWFHVNASLLRYWENEFDILRPRKTRKGDRLFRPEDVKNLQLIYFLLRQRKFSIEGAKQYLKENKKKADVQMQLIQALTKFRTFLLEWKANLGA